MERIQDSKKDQIRQYEEELVSQHILEFFSPKVKTGQTKWGALLEAHVNSLVGAPPAIIAHITILSLTGDFAIENPVIFATASWPIFFYISVGRMFLFRRIFQKFGVNLEPVTIIKRFNAFLRHGFT